MATEVPVAPASPDASPQCLTTNLGWLLSQASFAYGCELVAALEPLGVGPRGVCVLTTALSGEFTQTKLAHAVGLDKTMMMVTLDELERLGLAERRRSATDRRAHVVGVTAAGERKIAEAQRVIERVQTEVLGSLPAPERDALVSGLARLVCDRLAEPAECQQSPRRREPKPSRA